MGKLVGSVVAMAGTTGDNKDVRVGKMEEAVARLIERRRNCKKSKRVVVGRGGGNIIGGG